MCDSVSLLYCSFQHANDAFISMGYEGQVKRPGAHADDYGRNAGGGHASHNDYRRHYKWLHAIMPTSRRHEKMTVRSRHMNISSPARRPSRNRLTGGCLPRHECGKLGWFWHSAWTFSLSAGRPHIARSWPVTSWRRGTIRHWQGDIAYFEIGSLTVASHLRDEFCARLK